MIKLGSNFYLFLRTVCPFQGQTNERKECCQLQNLWNSGMSRLRSKQVKTALLYFGCMIFNIHIHNIQGVTGCEEKKTEY